MPDISRKGRGLALLREAQSRAEKGITSEKDESVEMNPSEQTVKSEEVFVVQHLDPESDVKENVNRKAPSKIHKKGRRKEVSNNMNNDFRPYLNSSVRANLDIVKGIISDGKSDVSYNDAINFLFNYFKKHGLKSELLKKFDL